MIKAESGDILELMAVIDNGIPNKELRKWNKESLQVAIETLEVLKQISFKLDMLMAGAKAQSFG